MSTTQVSDAMRVTTSLDATKLTGNLPAISGASLTNLPAASVHYFDAHLNSNLALTDSVDTILTGLTEDEDSDGWFASGRWTPLVAGRYYIMASGQLTTGSAGSLWHNGNCSVKRNGTAVTLPTTNDYSTYHGQTKTMTASVIVNMNGSSDYVEMYVNLNVTSGSPVCVGTTTGNTRFCGFYIGA